MVQHESRVDRLIREAYERGEFDDLPGAGKPLRLSADPDWWVKGLVEREQIRGILPPTLALRREREELPATLDAEHREEAVRELVADFNRRVAEAILRPHSGPPVVIGKVDVEQAVAAWRERRRTA